MKLAPIKRKTKPTFFQPNLPVSFSVLTAKKHKNCLVMPSSSHRHGFLSPPPKMDHFYKNKLDARCLSLQKQTYKPVLAPAPT